MSSPKRAAGLIVLGLIVISLPSRAGGQDTSGVVTVPSALPGIVVEVHVRAGDKVQQGDVLAKLESRLAQLDVEAARARLEVAEAMYRVVLVATQGAQHQVERVKALQASKAVSEEEVNRAILALETHKAEVHAKQAAVKLAQIEVQKAQFVLDQHIIHSPGAGVVALVHVNPGEAVSKFGRVVQIKK